MSHWWICDYCLHVYFLLYPYEHDQGSGFVYGMVVICRISLMPSHLSKKEKFQALMAVLGCKLK